LFGTFKSRRQATEALRKIAEQHRLCLKALGLESGRTGPCFAYQLKRCKGVCCGDEPEALHTLRLQQALIAHKLKTWPFAGKIGIEEYNMDHDLRQIHVFEQWTYLGVADSDETLQALREQSAVLKFDHDTYKLLLKMLAQKKTRVLNLSDAS
jgi:DNA polymerase-3 subunit epsilon